MTTHTTLSPSGHSGFKGARSYQQSKSPLRRMIWSIMRRKKWIGFPKLLSNEYQKSLESIASTSGIGLYRHFHYHWRADIWRWEAKSGTLMDWSQDLGWYHNWELKQRKMPPWNFFDDKCYGSLKFLGGTFVLKNFWCYGWGNDE